MNSDDYAVIIGLSRYPGLSTLEGPENDARAFRNWVTDPNGGGVPNDKTHIKMALSADFKEISPAIWHGRPMVSEVQALFWELHALYVANTKQKGTPRIGRRLYIYMAGHGIAPSAAGSINEHEAALLMGNVNSETFGPTYHIPGAYTATWFALSDCFEEIFLFMDCCRGPEWVPGLGVFLPTPGNANNAKRCYMFAAQWSQNARGKAMPDEGGDVRGFFTKTLILGLSGGAALPDPNDPAVSVITVSSLRSFIYGNLWRVASMNGTDDGVGIQEPDIDYWPKRDEGRDILIKTMPRQAFPVMIKTPTTQAGRVQIFKDSQLVAEKDVTDGAWTTDLSRGLYKAVLLQTGEEIVFKVTGAENIYINPASVFFS